MANLSKMMAKMMVLASILSAAYTEEAILLRLEGNFTVDNSGSRFKRTKKKRESTSDVRHLHSPYFIFKISLIKTVLHLKYLNGRSHFSSSIQRRGC